MISATINEKSYSIKTDWKDFTIQHAIQIRTLLDKIPETLKPLYELYVTEETDENKGKLNEDLLKIQQSITKRENIKTFPDFYGQVIMLCSDIPKSVMDQVVREDRVNIYNQFCLKTVCALLYQPSDVEEVIEFTLDKVVYKAPKKFVILNQERPMGKAQAIEFAEAADLELFADEVAGGKYNVLPNIISILYRPEGEKYNEETCLLRAEQFKNLTMDIGFGVFFYCLKLGVLSSKLIQISKAQAQIKELEQQRQRQA